MLSLSFDFSFPFSQYKELLDVDGKTPFPYIAWHVNASRTNSILSVYASLKPIRDRYSDTIFFISIGLLTFDFDFSIISTRSVK